MYNPETQQLIDLVEERSGYRVTVDVASGFYEHAQMISARPDAPVHLIRVNADRRAHADYIIAAQCAMLLVLWSDPSRIPSMLLDQSKCDFLAAKWAKAKPLRQLPADVSNRMASFYAEGLIKQASSTPLEIRVADICHRLCPSLREMQAESFNADFRRNSEAFSPKVKGQAPLDVFTKNITMNAALALKWANLSGNRICLLPYESAGFIEPGQRLLGFVDSLPEETSVNHVASVDAWADALSLRSLYRWDFSNRR
jgi:hypothetical protein